LFYIRQINGNDTADNDAAAAAADDDGYLALKIHTCKSPNGFSLSCLVWRETCIENSQTKRC